MNFPLAFLCAFAICLTLLTCGCENLPRIRETIYVVNHSDHNIRSAVPIRKGPFYPDSSITSILEGSMQTTPPERKAYFDHDGRGSIAEYLEASPLGLVSIFIFHPDTLAAFSDEQIDEDYKVLARYDLSMANLETLDFFVPYPPNEAMESMQVYVP